MNAQTDEEHRYLAVYRHAPTKKGEERGHGSHLSADGVRLARQVGDGLPRFDRVYASPYPRTQETALAMGFAVDDTLEFSCGYVSGEFEHHDQWEWERPYVRFAEMLRSENTLAKQAAADAQLWANLLTALPPNSRVLIISHGGSIEPPLVACLPNADHHTWGNPFSHCDGVHLTYTTSPHTNPIGRFTTADFHRASRFG